MTDKPIKVIKQNDGDSLMFFIEENELHLRSGPSEFVEDKDYRCDDSVQLTKPEAQKLYDFLGEWLGVPQIQSISKLNLKKGDIIVLTMPNVCNREHNKVKEHLEHVFPDNKAVILHGSIDMEKREDQLIKAMFKFYFKKYEQWNQNQRKDGIIMHTDYLGDIMNWLEKENNE